MDCCTVLRGSGSGSGSGSGGCLYLCVLDLHIRTVQQVMDGERPCGATKLSTNLRYKRRMRLLVWPASFMSLCISRSHAALWAPICLIGFGCVSFV